MKPNLKKQAAIAVGFVGSLLWGATCVIENQNAIAQVGGMFIRNELSNKCIDVAGDPGTVNGARLQLFDCELSGFNPSGRITDQKWEFIRGGFIRNKLSNKCIDVAGDPGTANGAPLQLFDCELSGFNTSGNTSDQRWEYIGAGFIRNGLSNKCIDVAGDPGTANGAPLQLFDCELSGFNTSGRTSDQRWRWEPKF
ncbi:RICIN domain-containing protein [Nostoc sp. XA010]|uniref:RICIN domain-containing protein n=1 Tax=Nostoc sp. XA010 TaxID=2780407 RepID=UPI001E48A57B|nr:RICIN domain-containing protein [Nostoc sp. XA010]MCC5657538.1 RICIN domain-containing protein [Nostoc sp. XA010]